MREIATRITNYLNVHHYFPYRGHRFLSDETAQDAYSLISRSGGVSYALCDLHVVVDGDS